MDFKSYYELTKPGIVRGNLITATAGFLLAARGNVNWGLLAAVLSGTALVIASSCVFNNYIDRDVDKKMSRTKKRPLVTGAIPAVNALIFATFLGLSGFIILASFTNWRTVVMGIFGVVVYLIAYGISKRRSIHSTVIGSLAGAAPLVAGYVAVTNRFDGGAFLLFVILVCWQMPHFYSIGIYRREDYVAAKLPILTVKNGILEAKKQIFYYILAFFVASSGLTIFGYAGYTYLIIMTLVSTFWLRFALAGFKATDNIAWARRMFNLSLIVNVLFSILISLDKWLP
ncbi:protoheme IX farnesyltransferase [Candidatus Saccharibacteria bacterium]|nr:protoheme IX farnesyltransferase [Candidatus Saccharibacteria bacterium]MBI3338042.1 protoheme IX farnesyltransferase [Candidatus Saccharibacteria bacterium]